MRPPPPRSPSQVLADRRPNALHRAAAPIRRSSAPSRPRARRSTVGHRGSVRQEASGGRAVQIGRGRLGRPRSWEVAGVQRREFGGEVGAPANASRAARRPWDCVSFSGPSDAGLCHPSSSLCATAGSSSFFRPVSRPTPFLPPSPTAIRAAVHHFSPPCRTPPTLQCRRPPLPIRLPYDRPPSPLPNSIFPSHPPQNYGRPPWLQLPHLGPPPASPYFWVPSPRVIRPPLPPHLPTVAIMSSGGGDDKFRPFSHIDGRFGSGYYQMPPPFPPPGFPGNPSHPPPHGPPLFDLNNSFGTVGAAGSQAAMPGPSQGYAGYGGQPSYYPQPFQGGGLLVDAGYPNRPGYLSPYKGYKYHQQQWRHGPAPSGEKELFNKAHSSLRSVIEQCFGMLKMKWRILHAVPSYKESIQSDIIIACCALHNYIIDHDDDDMDLAISTFLGTLSNQNTGDEVPERHEAAESDDDINMNVVRDDIAHAYFMSQQRR
ncbi:unnamed protein product [Urochloa humidicola]